MRARTILLFLSTAVAVALGAGVASAKGPTGVTITGDGMATIRVELDGSTPHAFMDLAEQVGLFSDAIRTPGAPTQNLGRKLTVTWDWDMSGDKPTQSVYPDAEGGPLVYQARLGWYRAPAAIAESLRSLGVPDAPAPVAPAAAPSSGDRSSLPVLPLLLLAGAVVGMVAVGIIVVQRLHRRAHLAT